MSWWEGPENEVVEAPRIIIIGAGGHARVVYDCLRLSLADGKGGKVLGFTDDNSGLWGRELMGLPILGPIDRISDLDANAVVIGIGDNAARKRLYKWATGRGYTLVNVIHPAAVIATDVSVGRGVAIFANVVVNSGSSIGNDAVLNTACTVDHDCRIGDHAHVAPGAHLAGGVEVGEGVVLGVGASVVPYRKIGNWSVVGAGTVVLEDIPDQVQAFSVPAKVTKVRLK